MSPTSSMSLPLPPSAYATAPGQQHYDSGNSNGQGNPAHMPPPPLPPVVIPQNNNPIPTAITSPDGGIPAGMLSPGSSSNSSVRRAAPEPNKRALYVGGLDTRVTEDILRQIFEVAGHVQNVKIIPDKNLGASEQSKGLNYGFVEYDDPGAAERAMSTLNGRRVHQSPKETSEGMHADLAKEIKVNWAYQSNNQTKEDTSNHYHIFVGDLSNEVNDEVLLQAFSAFGSVSEARVMWDMKTGRSRGYGFVAFRDREQAEKALSSMDGEWLGSRAIRCNWANQKGQPSISQQQAMTAMGMTPTTPFGHHHFPTQGVQSYDMVFQQTPQWQTTCYVGNLTPYTTQNDLVPLFQNFGYVVETRFQSDRGFAFVKMDTHENAAMAICQLSGYNVNGRPLKCSWGKDRPPTGQFDGYSPQQPQTPGYPQPSPAYSFPQYGGPSPMTPQGGPHSASGGPMPAYPPQHQSPMGGPSPGNTNWNQPQGGYGGPTMNQGYQMQGGPGGMPPSAGGYGRGNDRNGGGWGGPPSAGGYPSNGPPGQGYGGYHG
ncbi:MAG: hypothetical protein L6R37_007585 [Teloschistes peruensis]|nr:MAG: hypothetical protein L6R37_007585 [Teloschistes peruensis]